MRIGIDVRPLQESSPKGIGKSLSFLLSSLQIIDDINEYYLFSDSKLNNNLNVGNGRFKKIAITAKNDFLWEQVSLPNAVWKHKINIFHSPANTTFCWPSCPKVLTIHDTMSHNAAKNWGRRENLYWNTLQPLAYRSVKKLIVPTSYIKNIVCEHFKFKPDRVAVIHHGVSSNYKVLDEATVNKHLSKLNIRIPYIMALGSKLERKNVKGLLQAFNLMAAKMPEITLVIAGLSGYKPIEEYVSQLRNTSQIKLTGYIPEETLISLYNKAEAFVFPSLDEGFGLPPIEAMACGAPVVASNATCIPEVVGDAAYLVDCNSPNTLADAIHRVLNDVELRLSLKARGLNHAKKYTWQKTAEQTLTVYEELMSKS